MVNYYKSPKKILSSIYANLHDHFGEQQWWPAETNFEVLVGAIFTQQTSWRNVEKTIDRLKSHNLMSPKAIATISESKLRHMVKPSGFFRQKTRRLRKLCKHLAYEYDGNLVKFFDRPLRRVRQELLDLEGIGPETADSMILYAGDKATFVVDAYTIRFLKRLGLIEGEGYETVKNFFESNIPRELNHYKEYHALIVELCKTYCKTKPLCSQCPLNRDCVHGRNSMDPEVT